MVDFNVECIKDCMLLIQQKLSNANTDIPKPISWAIIYNDEYLTSRYSVCDIKYTLTELLEINYIISKDYLPNYNNGHVNRFHIYNITPDGYDFLKIAKDDKLWKKTVNKVSTINRDIVFKSLTTVIASIISGLAQKAIITL